MKKVISVFCVLFLIMPVLTACRSEANQPGQLIAGRWEPDGSARFQVMEFIPDSDNPRHGKVNLRMMGNEMSGEYEITSEDEQQQLTIVYTLALLPTTRKYRFTIEGDALVLQEEDSPASVTYRRVVAE